MARLIAIICFSGVPIICLLVWLRFRNTRNFLIYLFATMWQLWGFYKFVVKSFEGCAQEPLVSILTIMIILLLGWLRRFPENVMAELDDWFEGGEDYLRATYADFTWAGFCDSLYNFVYGVDENAQCTVESVDSDIAAGVTAVTPVARFVPQTPAQAQAAIDAAVTRVREAHQEEQARLAEEA